MTLELHIVHFLANIELLKKKKRTGPGFISKRLDISISHPVLLQINVNSDSQKGQLI